MNVSLVNHKIEPTDPYDPALYWETYCCSLGVFTVLAEPYEPEPITPLPKPNKHRTMWD